MGSLTSRRNGRERTKPARSRQEIKDKAVAKVVTGTLRTQDQDRVTKKRAVAPTRKETPRGTPKKEGITLPSRREAGTLGRFNQILQASGEEHSQC